MGFIQFHENKHNINTTIQRYIVAMSKQNQSLYSIEDLKMQIWFEYKISFLA